MAQKLSFLEASFLRMESPEHPFHVAGLMILKLPRGGDRQYLRRLATHLGRLNQAFPVFNKKLGDPTSTSDPVWVDADDYDPSYHVWHYALAQPGRFEELLRLVTRAHEQILDRGRPLWEMHLIEGLPDEHFALYCKIHHALVDGVAAFRLIGSLFSEAPDRPLDLRRLSPPRTAVQRQHPDILTQLLEGASSMAKQSRALPEILELLSEMSLNTLRGSADGARLPFTAPGTILNGEVDSRRTLITTELSLAQVRRIGHHYGGTVNDALVAICGGALREYLQGCDALPRESLHAALPVSVRSSGEAEGNRVSLIICPFGTDLSDPAARMKRIVRVMRKAKNSFGRVSNAALHDYTNMLTLPIALLTVTGNITKVPPPYNVIVSNIPGSAKRLYLDGSTLERVYPLSIISSGIGLNITVASYAGKLYFAIMSCPTGQPGISSLGDLIQRSYRKLRV